MGSTVTTYQAFCIALSAMLLMVLSMVASRLATDLITGGPTLGVGTSVRTMGSAYNTTVSAATSRPAVMAVKAAAALPVMAAKGAAMALSVQRSIVSGGGKTTGSAGTTGTALADAASRLPDSRA